MKDKTISYADKINALVVQISDAAVKTFDDEDDWRLDAVVTDPLQAFGRGIEGYIEAAFAEERSRIEQLEAENARFKDALEEIAEESDRWYFLPCGRHDGLPEPCPAHEDVVMWLRAREALEGTEDDG